MCQTQIEIKEIIVSTKTKVQETVEKPVKQSDEGKDDLTLGKHAGERVTSYMDMKWPEIAEFTNGEESQDAKCAMLIACHIIVNADKYKIEKVSLLDNEGKQVVHKSKKLTAHAIPLKVMYDVIARCATDVTMFHGANALTSGMYRISLPDHSMKSEDGKTNTYARGGIYFAKSKKISLKSGFYFTLPLLIAKGWYKKNAPTQPELKDACERLAKRVANKAKK